MKLKAVINNKEYDIVQGATFSEEYNETLDSGTIIIDNVSKIEDLKPYDDVIIYDSDVDTYTGYNIPGYKNNTEYLQTFSEDNGDIISNIYGETCKCVLTASIIECLNHTTNKKGTLYYRTGASTTIYYDSDKEQYYFTYVDYKPPYANIKAYFVKSDNVYICEYQGHLSGLLINKIEVNYLYEGSSGYQGFYKHLLIDQYTEKLLNITEKRYKYSIELFSETKKLETIQLPNVSITQPAEISAKLSVYDYLKRFVSEYTPKVKISIVGQGKWDYYDKLVLDESLKEVFSDVYAPDFSLTTPSLKDVIAQLMTTRDRIPYVKDNVIYALDITQRNGSFYFDNDCITNVLGSMSSSNFADNLYRPYQNALSNKHSCHLIEYCGYRNSNNGLLTIDNMRIETKYPIYRVNKIYLCYYKKGNVVKDSEVVGTRTFLCKQDITKLCMIDSARNILSQNWKEFESLPKGTDNAIAIDDMAKYQMSTFSYSIGSNYISGWGDKYEHNKDYLGWFKTTYTVIQNIATQLDIANPYGTYAAGYIADLGSGEIFVPIGEDLSNMISAFSSNNESQKMKGFFFQVDYEAFYNGTTIISKDGGRDDITMIDNSSTSLSLLEKDGIFQKEKVNRFSNKAYQINAIYTNINQIQALGSVYDDDVIIYHREYSCYANIIQTTYYGTKDYVLKNYFTSVYSKNRPFALLSYDQSITRAENKKINILLSKNKLYYEGSNNIAFENFDNNFLQDAISCFNPSSLATSKGVIATPKKIDAVFINCGDDKNYQCDINSFVSGYSLCFNARMFDNISMGVYVDEREPDYWNDNYIGSTQKWYKVVDDYGFLKEPEVYLGKFDSKGYYHDKVAETSDTDIKETYYERIFKQPYLLDNSYFTSKIKLYFNNLIKDNKETLDFTFQIEPLSDDDVAFSTWIMKLCDLSTTYQKVDKTYEVYDANTAGLDCTFYSASLTYVYADTASATTHAGYNPAIMLSITNDDFSNLKNNFNESGIAIHNAPLMIWNSNSNNGNGVKKTNLYGDRVGYYSFYPEKIVAISDTSITIRGIEIFKYMDAYWLWGVSTATQETDIVLTRATSTNPVGHVDFDYENNVIFSDTFPSLNDPTTSDPYPMMKSKTRALKIRSRADFATIFNIDVSPKLIGGSTGSQSKSTLQPTSSTLVSLGGGMKTIYYKNMFIQFSNDTLKKEIIYEEFANKPSGIDDNVLVSDVFKYSTDNQARPFIAVNIPSDVDCSSIRFWFYNQEEKSYVFVFGVNLTSEEKTNKYAKIYLSLMQTKDERVYNNTMERIGVIRNCATSDYTDTFGISKEYETE